MEFKYIPCITPIIGILYNFSFPTQSNITQFQLLIFLLTHCLIPTIDKAGKLCSLPPACPLCPHTHSCTRPGVQRNMHVHPQTQPRKEGQGAEIDGGGNLKRVFTQTFVNVKCQSRHQLLGRNVESGIGPQQFADGLAGYLHAVSLPSASKYTTARSNQNLILD